MYDIIIIGAGVTGCAVARYLSRYEGRMLVLEKAEDVCCGTSKANSAIVHAGYDATHGSLMAKLNVEGSRRMPALAKELDFAYDQCGSLVVCLSEQDRPNLVKLYENGVANGVKGLRIIERDELVKMEPNVSDNAVAALWAPTGGIVCPFGLTYAFAENAAKNGVKFQFDTTVTGFAPIEGGWRVETDKGSFETRLVVNAAGVHADELHNAVDAAHPMQIIARRGDYFLLDHAAAGHVHHTIFQLPGKYGKGVLVTPTVHGNLLVGPNAVEQASKTDLSTSAEGLRFRHYGGRPERSAGKVRPGGEGPAHAPDYHQLCRPARPRAAARFLHWRDCPRLCGLRCHRVPRPVQRPRRGRHGGRHREKQPASEGRSDV